jgi:hypothetical protein
MHNEKITAVYDAAGAVKTLKSKRIKNEVTQFLSHRNGYYL